ncbi:MAG: 50S ribosomal protein L11 methyltransferase [Gammaproteobacteria bacterium]|nr:50S ribosomal protein L11 methyltransferase [Gammaproteobacteria bacterium]MCP5136721.1 50S ribosomal protein L11 methyltransferase [Gammaproteobacteria bacterium]
MPWLELTLSATPTDADTLSDALDLAGAAAITLRDAADQPIFEPPPGASKVWDQTEVIGLFESDVDVDALLLGLSARLGQLPAWRLQPLEDRDWVRAWMDDYRPMRFGERLYVVPRDMTPPDPAAINLRLDPGLAFGTGTHPTTALCLRWLDATDLKGKTVIDYGCGSGILAIAALLLGAARVIAVDNDPQALIATADNARDNGVADRLETSLPDDCPSESADILVANILAAPLMSLVPTFARRVRPGGLLTLSGILDAQGGQVKAAYQPDFVMHPATAQDGWLRLDGQRKTPNR